MMSILSADQIGQAINLLDRTEGRNLPVASSAIPSSTTIQKIASSFFESKSIDPEQGSWLALSDTLSNGSKSITLAQVEEASLLGLVERLDDLKFAVDTLNEYSHTYDFINFSEPVSRICSAAMTSRYL